MRTYEPYLDTQTLKSSRPVVGRAASLHGNDCHGSFEPQIVTKHQTRWTGLTTRYSPSMPEA
jgi:hypothetical protein